MSTSWQVSTIKAQVFVPIEIRTRIVEEWNGELDKEGKEIIITRWEAAAYMDDRKYAEVNWRKSYSTEKAAIRALKKEMAGMYK